ncbi:FHA domain-containing protein [Prosthecobacter sp.]|uniref:FHA domain-containing protein n=1 Tax=Prosthecobacter sp. TaxID=1965333 RepID=UPI003783BE36
MASVVFYMEDGTTLVHKLESDVTTIGRHPDSNVVLTCPSSSGRHAILKETDKGVFVQDLGSSNGTRVNGAEIEEALLKDGDRVGFGDVQAVFYSGDAPEVLEEKPMAGPRFPKSLPAPAPTINDEPPSPGVKARSGLSPVRRAYGKPAAGSYPDTTESGCMTGIIVTGLFVFAFVTGLALRHSKEMNGNILTDTIDKIFGTMPKIKIERKED